MPTLKLFPFPDKYVPSCCALRYLIQGNCWHSESHQKQLDFAATVSFPGTLARGVRQIRYDVVYDRHTVALP